MSTQVGVGFCSNAVSKDAAFTAGREALANAGISSADFAIAFATGKHDPHAIMAGFREALGPDARIYGGSAFGLITNTKLSFGGAEVGLAVFKSDSIRLDAFVQGGLDCGESEVGRLLGQEIQNAHLEPDSSMFLFYDSVKTPARGAPPVLNMATPLIGGVSESIGTWPRVAGGGFFADAGLELPTYQWFEKTVLQQSAMALCLSGNVRMDALIIHGCRPSGTYRTITKAQHNVIFEIDGQPALDVVEKMMGPGAEKSIDEYPLYLTFGVNKGDKFGPYREGEWASRLCFAVIKESKALVMFEPDLKEGDQVQLMRRSINFDYVKDRVEQLKVATAGRKPLLALYIDCAGRCSLLAGTELEEASEVQRAIGPEIPLLGFYSGVEIARVGPDVHALDWTGVLCILSEA
jgi:hypothetical protein